jgi:hypothetical protein
MANFTLNSDNNKHLDTANNDDCTYHYVAVEVW